MSLFFPCKYRKLINALIYFGFDIKEGVKHTRAKCINNGRKTTIPRHIEIKREVVKSICLFLIEKEISEEKIVKKLK